VGWLPGVSTTLFYERCARFAATLVGLLEGGMPLDESLRVAADGSGDVNLRSAGIEMARAAQAGHLRTNVGDRSREFPPLLRWAVWHSDEPAVRAHALEIAARIYRQTAERRTERLRTLAPLVAVVTLGGTFTLLYGLALFVPLVELLHTMAG
jgi:type IV pilus assembly protein PilC